MLRIRTAIAFTALATLASATAWGKPMASRTIEFRAFVPIVCKTTFEPYSSSDNTDYQILGTVNEFCNSARGYRVIVQVDGETEDAGTIYFGGQAFPVTSNEIVVTDVDGPGRLNRELGYEAGENQPYSLQIRIEPKYV